MLNEHENVVQKLPFHLSRLNSPKLVSLLHTDSQLFTQILDALKQYEPYSAPFLYKVSKRDVPNYYDVIKNPMDLGTMCRNVKRYNRDTFKRDLELIWSNCYTFNGQSIYTDYAQKLKERADYLYNYYSNTKADTTPEIKEVQVQESSNVVIKEHRNYFLEKIAEECKDLYFDVTPLDSIHFAFHDQINIGAFSKRMRNDTPVNLDGFCSKKLLEQIIVVNLHKIGFTHVQTSAIKIFADALYYKLNEEAKSLDDKIIEKMMNIKFSDLNLFVAKSFVRNESEIKDNESIEENIDVEKNIEDEEDVIIEEYNNSEANE